MGSSAATTSNAFSPREHGMFYRLAGIRHTSYLQSRGLFPLAFDRGLVGAIVMLGLLAPWLLLNQLLSGASAAFGLHLGSDLATHAPLILYGGLIVGFLLFEPLGLAKIYDNVRKTFRVW